VTGLVLDSKALIQYGENKTDEPGSMIGLALDDPAHQLWVPVLCLVRAYAFHAGNDTGTALLDLLAGGPIIVESLDRDNARRVGRSAGSLGVTTDVAHALRVAGLYRAWVATADDETIAAAQTLGITAFDIRGTF
jgi:hypothetical protein